MKKIRLYLLILLLASVTATCFSAQKNKMNASKEIKYTSSLTAGDMSISWSVKGKNLFVQLTAPTTGWVSVGFDPEKIMKGANFIIGYVSNNTAVIEDQYGVDLFIHKKDTELGGKDNVENKKGKVENGRTEISFSIPLDSKDPYDKKLEKGKEYKVILAYGPDYDMTKHHVKRYTVKIKI